MRSILIFVDEDYQELELWYPKLRLEEAGFQTVIAASEKGKIYKGKYGYPCQSDLSYKDVDVSQFAALVIPGGFAPDRIRRDEKALSIVQKMDEAKKVIAFICHGGWVPISAKILKGRRATCFIAIKDDLENAGALFEDSPVVVDGHLISSRKPQDLPQFCSGILKCLS